MALDLTTLDNVKVLHGGFSDPSTQRDAIIQALISRTSRRIERWIGAEFTKQERVEVFDVVQGQTLFTLRAYPIDPAASFVVKNEYNGVFADGITIDSLNYYVDQRRGRLKFRGAEYALISGPGTLQVTYTAGIGTVAYQLPVTAIVGTFLLGETIVGGTSGAHGTMTATSALSPLTFTPVSGVFAAGEVITGLTSGATALAATGPAAPAAATISSDYDDLVLACEMQVLADLTRAPHFGSTGRNVGGAGSTFADDKVSAMAPEVLAMVEQYRRA